MAVSLEQAGQEWCATSLLWPSISATASSPLEAMNAVRDRLEGMQMPWALVEAASAPQLRV